MHSRRAALGLFTGALAGSVLPGCDSNRGTTVAKQAIQPDLRGALAALSPAGLTDQDGKTFDATTLQGESFIAAFGFEGCANCQKITRTLLDSQAKMKERGIAIPPTVIISIKPEQDGDTPESYVKSYRDAGVEGKLVLLFAPNKEAVHAIAKKFPNAIYDVSNADSHPPSLYVCGKDGEFIKDVQAIIELGDTNKRQVAADKIATAVRSVARGH